jgi:hypothetical protein
MAAWLALTPALAAAPAGTSANYEVEVLVFDEQLPEFEGSEIWTRPARAPDPAATSIESLPPSPDFAGAVSAMRGDSRYRVLLHKRWVQPAESKTAVPPVLLATPDNELNGTLHFYLSRFLHLELNVSYQPHNSAIGAPGGTSVEPPIYMIDEQRRVKSNDLNYFDHPKFGVLVRVTPATG